MLRLLESSNNLPPRRVVSPEELTEAIQAGYDKRRENIIGASSAACEYAAMMVDIRDQLG